MSNPVESSPVVTSYRPLPAWEPVSVDPEFATMVSDYDTSEPSCAQESKIGRVLARQSQDFIPGGEGHMYRAEFACEVGAGNCMAHTEAGIAVAEHVGLNMMTVWGLVENGSWHASSLWLGRASLWDVDFYHNELNDAYKYNANASQEFSELVRGLNAKGKGLHLWTPTYPTGSFSHEVIHGDPGDTPNPFVYRTSGSVYTILPSERGIDMFGALGDLVRYRQEKPARYAKLADQIMRFIPPGLIPERR